MELDNFLHQMARNWGWVLLRGVAAIVFGVLAFLWPGVTLLALAILWGAWVMADGMLALVTAFRVREQGRAFWPLILIGVLGIAAGVVAVVMPGLTAIVLLMFIAAWAIVTGALQIVVAIRLRREMVGEWLLALSGLVSIAFGVLMVTRPGAGALAVIWVIGAYSIFFGLLLAMLAFKLKGIAARATPTLTGTPRPA
jgi:uncharacterized membrane protein HdeD (DUF308 family)